jgi:glutathione S-transferase
MKRLWHWPLDPALEEKRAETDLRLCRPGAPIAELPDLPPGTELPVLMDTSGEQKIIASGTHAILEYLEGLEAGPRLMPFLAKDRAEVRRLWQWSETSFGEVNRTLLAERENQWVRRSKQSDTARLRDGIHALKSKIAFLEGLAGMRPYMAGRTLSLADLSIAAHLSAYDYFGDVPWDLTPDLKQWYARMKSRPSFRPLLADKVEGTRPPRHYADLDF